jgi:hypothetical protein
MTVGVIAVVVAVGDDEDVHNDQGEAAGVVCLCRRCDGLLQSSTLCYANECAYDKPCRISEMIIAMYPACSA